MRLVMAKCELHAEGLTYMHRYHCPKQFKIRNYLLHVMLGIGKTKQAPQQVEEHAYTRQVRRLACLNIHLIVWV